MSLSRVASARWKNQSGGANLVRPLQGDHSKSPGSGANEYG